MKIACLGWGSLIWKPEELPIAGAWNQDGPQLPIEFCRIGDGGELATALCINAVPVPVMWAELTSRTVSDACQSLRKREAIPDEREDGVGMLTDPQHTPGPLAQWAQARGLDAVIWTALPPRYQRVEGLIPSCNEAIAYLSGLSGKVAEHAYDYIRRVPEQIATPYRQKLEQVIEQAGLPLERS